MQLTQTEADILLIPVRVKMKTISVRTKVGGKEEMHVLVIIELLGGQYVANPYYHSGCKQKGLLKLDPERIQPVGGIPETGFYRGILLEIPNQPEV